MAAKLFNFFNLVLLISIYLASCTRPEQKNFFEDIVGDWNLVYADGGRLEPRTYPIGEEVWKFGEQKVEKINFKYNTQNEFSYSIVDTLGGLQLKIDNIFFANIELLNADSLKLHAEKFTGCGGTMRFVR
jgi:hypothetical protein